MLVQQYKHLKKRILCHNVEQNKKKKNNETEKKTHPV